MKKIKKIKRELSSLTQKLSSLWPWEPVQTVDFVGKGKTSMSSCEQFFPVLFLGTFSGTFGLVLLGNCCEPSSFCLPVNEKAYMVWLLGLEWTNSHQCTSSGWSRSSCFGDEPKAHPLPLPRDFLGPFFAPKFSPNTYLPCCYLPHLISCLLHITKLRGDVRHKAWGRWRAQHWRNVKRRRQEKHFIPNTEAREER